MPLPLPQFTIDAANKLVLSDPCTALKEIESAKVVSAVQALADAAALNLLSAYANKVALWTQSESAKLARTAERAHVLSTFRNVFTEGKYVLLQQRDTSQDGPAAKRLRITHVDVNHADIGECRDSEMQYYEVAGGRLMCLDAQLSVINATFDYNAMERSLPTTAVTSRFQGQGLLDDPYDHEYQLRHYLLNMCKFVTQSMQGSTLQNTEELHRQIELTDMHASHTISLDSKRQRDTAYVMSKAVQTLFQKVDQTGGNHTNNSSLYVVKPRGCEPYRMTPCQKDSNIKLTDHADANCVCTSDDNYNTKYAVFVDDAETTFFSGFSPTQHIWKTIASVQKLVVSPKVRFFECIDTTTSGGAAKINLSWLWNDTKYEGIFVADTKVRIYFSNAGNAGQATETLGGILIKDLCNREHTVITSTHNGNRHTLKILLTTTLTETYDYDDERNCTSDMRVYCVPELEIEDRLDALAVNFWEMPKTKSVEIDELENEAGSCLFEGTSASDLVTTKFKTCVVTKAAFGTMVRLYLPTQLAIPSPDDPHSRWLQGLLRPALVTATSEQTPKPNFFNTDCLRQTIAFAQGIPFKATTAVTPFPDAELTGYELIPVANEDVPLYSTALNVPVLEFRNQAAAPFQWFVGGMPTLALDGLMAAALYAKTIAG